MSISDEVQVDSRHILSGFKWLKSIIINIIIFISVSVENQCLIVSNDKNLNPPLKSCLTLELNKITAPVTNSILFWNNSIELYSILFSSNILDEF